MLTGANSGIRTCFFSTLLIVNILSIVVEILSFSCQISYLCDSYPNSWIYRLKYCTPFRSTNLLFWLFSCLQAVAISMGVQNL